MSGAGAGVSDIFSGIGDFAAASGYREEAKAYATAAKLSTENAGLVKLSTGIQETEATRMGLKVQGAVQAGAGANGESLSGSAMDVLRSNAQQISLQKNLVALQGEIDIKGWEEKAAADTGQSKLASAESTAAQIKGAGSILGGVLSIFGL